MAAEVVTRPRLLDGSQLIRSLHDPHAAVWHAEHETHFEQDVAEHDRVATQAITVLERRYGMVRCVRTQRALGLSTEWARSPERHVVVGNIEAHFAQAPVERRNVLAAGRTGPQSCPQAPTAILDFLTTPRVLELTGATRRLFLDHQRHARPFVTTVVPGVAGKHLQQPCITDAPIRGLEVGLPSGTPNHSHVHTQIALSLWHA